MLFDLARRWRFARKTGGSLEPSPQLFPPGHFYSPIVNPGEIVEYLDKTESRRETPGLDLRLDAQLDVLAHLETFAKLWPQGHDAKSMRYDVENDQFGPGDAICYFAILGMIRPRRVIEVGSGWSSAVGLDANEIHGTQTHFTFIEPYPDRLLKAIRSNDAETTTIIRAGVQSVDVAVFDQLESNDVLFIDSTHVMKAGSDVQFLLGEVLPRLRSGVLVHIHDMFFPFEYPRAWVEQGRNWNELYAVRCFLQFNTSFEVFFWNHCLAALKPSEIYGSLPPTQQNPGGGLWLRIRAAESSA